MSSSVLSRSLIPAFFYWASMASGEEAARPAGDAEARIVVRLVTDHASNTLASRLEDLQPVVQTFFDGSGTKTVTVGERATLWVRNASVDGKYTFEKYYQGKYINRSAEVEIAAQELAPGEHLIQPGSHRFTLAADGTLSTTDPEIKISGRTVSLRLHRVDVLPVDAEKGGPAEHRIVGAQLGLFALPLATVIDADHLPKLSEETPGGEAPVTLLSHARVFHPLSVYLPSNQVGQGYLLYPSWQAFHVTPEGQVIFQGPRVAGIESEGLRLTIAYRTFTGRLNTNQALQGAVGNVPLTTGKQRQQLGPTLEKIRFGAGMPGFYMMVDNDFSRNPNKFFLADNTGPDVHAVRLMALEWDSGVFTAGENAAVSLRFLENFALFRPEDVRDWKALLAKLREEAGSKEPCPGLRILERGESDAQQFELILKSAGDQEPSEAVKATFLGALNTALCDTHFYQKMAFEKVQLSEASREAASKTPGSLEAGAMLRFHRQLVEDAYPEIFQKLERQPSLPQPKVRMAYSPYPSNNPALRSWTYFDPVEWRDGKLTFHPPKVDDDFYFFRVMVQDAADTASFSPIEGELLAAVIQPGQIGTASFLSNKGRDAFVAEEEIRLEAALRSKAPRSSGQVTLVLKHPGGWLERSVFTDPGGTWQAKALTFPAEKTRSLRPGRYELSFENLPAGMAARPFHFDLVSRARRSLFSIIKPSKYTQPMNDLVGLHLNPLSQTPPYDLERAVESLAELGYNRIDLMTYTTHHHVRPHAQRENLAGRDERLMAPDSVYAPSPRDQILNACVRRQIEFSDVFLSYNDFHLPRFIDGYVTASERWIKREMASMRHSPALAGMMLYDEMYQVAVVGVPEAHATLFPKIRRARAEKEMGVAPEKIHSAMSRSLRKPPGQGDPEALEQFLRLRRWELHGWGDYTARVADAARKILPRARIGTYHQSFTYVSTGLGAVCSATDLDNGYHPDVFEKLDILASVHYTDNGGGWVHSPLMASALRFGQRRPVFINIPVGHECRYRSDGQYQRQMAFAMLAQGADGVSMFGLSHDFRDGPNPEMMAGKETTKHLNREILAPFGEIVSRTEPGYRKIGIVTIENQHILSEYKEIRTSNQIEELWVACWRLGYPAVFLREDSFEEPLHSFQVIFVPGIRFEGELPPKIVRRLEEAIQAGCKVLVEKGSVLRLPGIVQLEDLALQNFYFGSAYAPTFYDDELNKAYEKSQIATDYLSKKLPEWAEPAASGPFTVGPNWRTSGSIHYLIMANFEDPDYSYAVKQIMAKPVRIPLRIPASRGQAAYDLLAQKPVALVAQGKEIAFEVDMTRVQGALLAFLPEPVAKLRVTADISADKRALRLSAALVGAAGNAIPGLFPTRIRLRDSEGLVQQEFFRVLGGELRFELDIPAGPKPPDYTLEVREAISGKTVEINFSGSVFSGPALEVTEDMSTWLPNPNEVREFLENCNEAVVIHGQGIPGIEKVAAELAESLGKRGITATLVEEMKAFRYPSGDASLHDPMSDGFHSWRMGFEVIQPAMAIDKPVILIGGKLGCYLMESLGANGFLTELPKGAPQQATRPSIQVAPRAFHPAHDTLCLIANDDAGLRRATQSLLAARPQAQLQGEMQAVYASLKTVESAEEKPMPAPLQFMGNNEMVVDIQFDKVGNLYATTWGHGHNLYSLDASGNLRFARCLPEMGPSRMEIFDDRILIYTSAGARLYQLGLDGKPICQARLNMDPGPMNGEDGYHLSYANYTYIPETRQIAYVADIIPEGMMRIVDESGRVLAEWVGGEYRDKDYTDRILRRALQGFAFNPDRTRLAQIETTQYLAPMNAQQDRTVYDTHLVLRDLSGKLLQEYKDIANDAIGAVQWEAGAPGPTVIAHGTVWQFDQELKLLGTKVHDSGLFSFGSHGYLAADGHALRYLRADKEISRIGPLHLLPTYAQLSPDMKIILCLDEYGLISLFEAETGKKRHEFSVPELGQVLRFSPDSSRFFIGSLRGSVACYDLQGKEVWRTALAQFNESLGKPAALDDPSFRDLSDFLRKTQNDSPGELDALVKLDANRLKNGDCETADGWQGPSSVPFHPEGYNSARSLKVGPDTLYQDVSGYLGNHVTWALEFFFKACPGSSSPCRLLAGLLTECQYSDTVVREFAAGENWKFGRVVIKSGRDASVLKAGFSTLNGEALVDSVTLRQIRFPSTNHLLYPPLYDVEPVVLTNPFFSEKYDPAGRRRDEAPNRVIVQNLPAGALNLVESAFLQNGRINEMSSSWYIHPFPGDTTIGIGLKEPRWVSLVALYFNVYDESNVTPHFDIYVLDVESKVERLVASVRHNKQLFRLLKFPPMKATQVTIKLVNAIQRLRTLTEIELYGPLSGREDIAGFAEAEGENTYMGGFSRVDKREKRLAAEYLPLFTTSPWGRDELMWSFPVSQIMVSENTFFLSRGLGHNEACPVGEPAKTLSLARSGSLGFSPHVTLYGGVLLKPGNDGKLYCIDPQSSRELWSAKLGERLRGCPVALSQDIFIASDTGKLYQVDIASGSILMELPLSGGVAGSLATDGTLLFLITEDGWLQCYHARNRNKVWAVPVAPYTESTPAIDGGVVYLADQKGEAKAVEAASGRVAWSAQLGQEFSRCPVVTPNRVIFGCRDGKLVVLDRASGNAVWALQVNSRFSYEPVVLGDQVLFFDDTKGKLGSLADGSVKDFPNLNLSDDPLVSISYYKGHLFFVPRHMEKWHQGIRVNDIWVGVAAGTFSHLAPKP